MKKVIAIAGVIIGGLVINAMVSFGALLLFLTLFPYGIILALLMLIGIIITLEKVSKICSMKLNMNKSLFLLCVGILPLLSSITTFFVVRALSNNSFWAGQMFGGLAEFIWSFSGICCSAFILIGMLVIKIFPKGEKTL